MPRHIRITAEPTLDNPSLSSVTVDVVVDDGGLIVGDHDLFGVVGDPQNLEPLCLPFVVYADGTLDYGSECETEDERYAGFDLRSGKVERGRILTISSALYGEQKFQIRDIQNLVPGEK